MPATVGQRSDRSELSRPVLEQPGWCDAGQRSNLPCHVGLVRVSGFRRRVGESAALLDGGQEALHPKHALERLGGEADLGEEDPPELPRRETERVSRAVDGLRRQYPHRVPDSRAGLDRADPCVLVPPVDQPAPCARTEDVLEGDAAIAK